MAESIEIEGLDNMRAALRDLPGELDRELMVSLRSSARRVRDRANGYAPVGQTGNLRSKTSITGSVRSHRTTVRVRWLVPYARVQEFAETYERLRKGRVGSVHYKGQTPRFAYRALEEMAGQVAISAWGALAQAASKLGLDVEI